MRRVVIVIVATVSGLVAVLSFHTKPSHLTMGALPGAAATHPAPTTSVATGPPPTQGSGGTVPPPTPSSTATTAPGSTRTATGAAIDYHFGVLSVTVTVAGTRITNVGIASLDDGGNFRSQSIDQQSIPLLEQQAIQAQSPNIRGVSGASYTSAGFAQSLQSAFSKLNLG